MIGIGDRRCIGFVADVNLATIDVVHNFAGLNGGGNDGFENVVIGRLAFGHMTSPGESTQCGARRALARPSAQYFLAMCLCRPSAGGTA